MKHPQKSEISFPFMLKSVRCWSYSIWNIHMETYNCFNRPEEDLLHITSTDTDVSFLLLWLCQFVSLGICLKRAYRWDFQLPHMCSMQSSKIPTGHCWTWVMLCISQIQIDWQSGVHQENERSCKKTPSKTEKHVLLGRLLDQQQHTDWLCNILLALPPTWQ